MTALTVLDLQEALNLAGVTDLNGEPLVEDDEKGPLTMSAWVFALSLFDDGGLALLSHVHPEEAQTSVAPHGHISTTTVGRITPS